MGARAQFFEAALEPSDRSTILMPPLVNPLRDLGPPAVIIDLPGKPEGKGRPRSRIVGATDTRPQFVSHYTPKQTTSYEAMLRYAAEREMAGRPLLDGGVRLHIYSVFTVPQSWSNKKREAALEGYVRPTVKPDFDNIDKMVDAFKNIVWRDDTQVVDWAGLKFYGEKPVFRAEIWQLFPATV